VHDPALALIVVYGVVLDTAVVLAAGLHVHAGYFQWPTLKTFTTGIGWTVG